MFKIYEQKYLRIITGAKEITNSIVNIKKNQSLIAVLIALALNACGTVQEKPKAAVNKKASSEVIIEANKKKDLKVTGLNSTPSPSRPKQKINYPPISHLHGMSRKHVVDLLGQPRFQRQDSPALIWQYQTEFCILDIFLYSQETKSKYQVNHFETRSRKRGRVEAKVCFISLLEAHKKRRSS